MEDAAAVKVAQALNHPLRLGYLRALRKTKELSPVEFARQAAVPLGNASYHVKALRESGVVEVSSQVARRGAMEHRYKFTGPQAKATKAVMDLLEEL
jgi:DNA-binding transcriptional ArsR family regulator